MPKATDLEEDFRSGILLARLANFFAPNLVSLDKIFDLDGVHFFRLIFKTLIYLFRNVAVQRALNTDTLTIL